MCRQLQRNIILGVDFGKKNCAGIQWTTEHTRVLSIKGIPAIEVEENELGLPVTATYHVKVPPRHNSVFEVKIHGETEGTHIIRAHPEMEERTPNIFQHEIAIISDDEAKPFPLVAVTNLDQAKTLHIGKGEIVGFAKPETKSVTYVATTNEINIEEYVDTSPRNWIPKGRGKPLLASEKHKKSTSRYAKDESYTNTREKCKNLIFRSEKQQETVKAETEWNDINKVIDSDFLISPGDIYPNRKVELQDTKIKDETKKSFEDICN